MKVNHKESGSDAKRTENRGLESNLVMTRHGQSGPVRSHVSDPAPRRAPNIEQALNVATLRAWSMFGARTQHRHPRIQ